MDDRTAALDDLIARLRARAADPARRADVTVDAFSASVRSMDLGSLLGAGRSISGALGQLLGEMRTAGTPSAETRARTNDLAALMGTPARPDLPAPANVASIAAAEAALGAPLPAALRRAWTEVADGGFGPGSGLLSVASAVDAYRELRAETPGPRGSNWPVGLLPVVQFDPGYDCVELATGRVITWDPEDLRERSNEAAWQRTFTVVAASVDAWLLAWVGSKTAAEQSAERMREMELTEARRAREHFRQAGPEARAAAGLPEVGWERVVWGGIGLEDDEPAEASGHAPGGDADHPDADPGSAGGRPT